MGSPRQLGNAEKIQDQRKVGLYPILQTQASPLPPLAEILKPLLYPHNSGLTLAHWGMMLRLYGAFQFFPLPVQTFRDSLEVSKRPFRRILTDLSRREIISLPYDQRSKWFSAGFPQAGIKAPTRAKTAHVEIPTRADSVHVVSISTRADSVHVEAPHGPNEPVKALEGPNEPVCSPVVVVDFKYNVNNHTPALVRETILGAPREILTKAIHGFQDGLLLPHLRAAVEVCPADPAARLRGAIFYLDHQLQTGFKARNVLAVLLKHVTAGNVLEEQTNLLEKAPSNAKSEKDQAAARAQAENERFLDEMGALSLERMKADFSHALKGPGSAGTKLKNFESFYQRNPNLDAFRAWAEKEIEQ